MRDFGPLLRAFEKYKGAIIYLFFGALTTAVNYLVYFPCYNLLGLSATASGVLAWTVAVAFAFVTNKPFVFKSRDWSAKVLWPELGRFIGCRTGSGLLESALLLLTVDILGGNGNLWKIILSILVVILNYFASKLLVFGKSRQEKK